MKKNKFLLILVIFIGVITHSVNLHSQEQDLEKLLEFGLEELMNVEVVTASKKPQRLSEVPATVRVITAEQIKERGYFTLEEAISDLPGVQFRNIDGFNSYVFLRGAPSQNNLILLLVDGIQINELNSGGFYGGGQFNLSNVKRIEVVYGPASALYGTNAISGIINIITNDPEDIPGGHASVLSGSFETRNVDFRYGYYDQENDVGFSTSGMYKTTDKADLKGNDGDNNWTEEMENFEDAFAFDGKLKFRNLTFGFLYQDKESSRTTNYKTVDSDKLDYGTLWHITFMNLWLKHKYDITDNTQLNSLVYYRDATVEDDTIAFIDKAEGVDPGQQVGYYRPNNQIGIEEQLNYRFSDSLNLIGGIVWEREILSEGFSETYSESQDQDPPTPDDPDKVTERLFSIYLQSQYKFTEALELTLGLRWDDSTAYDKVTTPRCGLVYHRDKITGKLLYSEAFRAPKPWDYTSGSGNPGLEPEEMKSYEGVIGYKFNTNLHATISIYHNKISDLLIFDVANNCWDNEGTLKTNGLELTIDYTLKGLTTYINYTFNDSEDDNDDQVPEIARHNANIGLSYAFYNNWKCNIRGNYLGDRKNPKTITATGRDEIDSDFLVHGNVSWNFRNWYFLLKVNNLFDTKYYHTSNRPPDRYLQPERAVLFKVQYEF